MDHAVHYRTAAGETKVEEVGTLDAAVSMVERLRNDEGVSDVRVYRQIPIEFKAYYKVSVVDDAGAGGQAPAAAPTPAPAPQPAADATPPAAPPSPPQSPPPGAMPLGPSASAQPSAQPSATPSETPSGASDEGDSSKRGSLFSRG
ncbi:MAG: hypothetical protein KY461_10980 [Actinobacteria bacterium]|nr:hypothetical protein [Actinomycetota bacterium]